jgi:hypothetical protein
LELATQEFLWLNVQVGLPKHLGLQDLTMRKYRFGVID